MKQILVAIICCTFATTLVAQTLGNVLSGKEGKLGLLSGFIQNILPYLKKENVKGNIETITPITYVLPSSMTVKDIMVKYSINAIELTELSSVLHNYNRGRFNNIILTREHANAVFVTCTNGQVSEGTIVYIFFSKKSNQWKVDTIPMDPTSKLQEGVQIVTY